MQGRVADLHARGRSIHGRGIRARLAAVQALLRQQARQQRPLPLRLWSRLATLPRRIGAAGTGTCVRCMPCRTDMLPARRLPVCTASKLMQAACLVLATMCS